MIRILTRLWIVICLCFMLVSGHAAPIITTDVTSPDIPVEISNQLSEKYPEAESIHIYSHHTAVPVTYSPVQDSYDRYIPVIVLLVCVALFPVGLRIWKALLVK